MGPYSQGRPGDGPGSYWGEGFEIFDEIWELYVA